MVPAANLIAAPVVSLPFTSSFHSNHLSQLFAVHFVYCIVSTELFVTRLHRFGRQAKMCV
jgi:hypothetical protein